MKVMIVEDDAGVRQLIKLVVASLAEDFCECGDGATALRLYRQQRPDWVLMDVRMGLKDGLTATREITAAFPEARIVMVTSHDDAAMRQAAREAGACAYLSKENLLALREILY